MLYKNDASPEELTELKDGGYTSSIQGEGGKISRHSGFTPVDGLDEPDEEKYSDREMISAVALTAAATVVVIAIGTFVVKPLAIKGTRLIKNKFSNKKLTVDPELYKEKSEESSEDDNIIYFKKKA